MRQNEERRLLLAGSSWCGVTMSERVAIPDEARKAAQQEAEDMFTAYELPTSAADSIAERITDAAAPHVARAAVVAELRALADGAYEALAPYGDERAVSVVDLRERIAQLEAEQYG